MGREKTLGRPPGCRFQEKGDDLPGVRMPSTAMPDRRMQSPSLGGKGLVGAGSVSDIIDLSATACRPMATLQVTVLHGIPVIGGATIAVDMRAAVGDVVATGTVHDIQHIVPLSAPKDIVA